MLRLNGWGYPPWRTRGGNERITSRHGGNESNTFSRKDFCSIFVPWIYRVLSK